MSKCCKKASRLPTFPAAHRLGSEHSGESGCLKPAAAAAVIVGSITPALLNSVVFHNVFVAKISGMEVTNFIAKFAPITIALSAIAIAGITVTINRPMPRLPKRPLPTPKAPPKSFSPNIPIFSLPSLRWFPS